MRPAGCRTSVATRGIRALAAAVALGATPPVGAPPAPPTSPDVDPQVVAQGLRHPWGVAFLPGGGFLVTEKHGGLVRVNAGGRTTPVAGLPADLDTTDRNPRDNRGLFDVALHPAFARNGRLFLTYTARGVGGTTTRLVAARLARDSLGVERLVDVRPLFEATPRSAERYHYGGALLVAEGRLYLTVGERHFRERDNPPLPAAQDPTDRRGKIYRFHLDGTPDRAASRSFGPGAPAGLYATGIRASQGMAWDAARRTIWFTDHGPTGGDEVNRLRAGANYGWPVRTAGRYRDADFRPARTRPGARYTEPVHVWADRTVAPTGLTVYTGRDFPEWRGDLIVAGLGRGYLVRLHVEHDTVRSVQYLMEDRPVRLRNVRQAPDGVLYAVTDEPNGRLLRLVRRR